jgi:TPR repeat protein
MGILRIFSAPRFCSSLALSPPWPIRREAKARAPGSAVPRQLDPIDAADLFDLAWKYDNGKGVAQDKTEAVRLYGKAAELIVSAIKMQYALSSGEGRFASWSEKFREELQML